MNTTTVVSKCDTQIKLFIYFTTYYTIMDNI